MLLDLIIISLGTIAIFLFSILTTKKNEKAN